jgi:spore maturation protein CgeB
LARALADHGRQTILARHTCAHRVDELLAICNELDLGHQGAELQQDAMVAAH